MLDNATLEKVFVTFLQLQRVWESDADISHATCDWAQHQLNSAVEEFAVAMCRAHPTTVVCGNWEDDN